jgi:hypothetical protein
LPIASGGPSGDNFDKRAIETLEFHGRQKWIPYSDGAAVVSRLGAGGSRGDEMAIWRACAESRAAGDASSVGGRERQPAWRAAARQPDGRFWVLT